MGYKGLASTPPCGFGSRFWKVRVSWILARGFAFVFHLGILMFQPQFLSLQTHRLQSITPPVSNYPLKMWVSAGLSVKILQLEHRKSSLDAVENAKLMIIACFCSPATLNAGVIQYGFTVSYSPLVHPLTGCLPPAVYLNSMASGLIMWVLELHSI